MPNSLDAVVRTLKNSDGTIIIYPQTSATAVYSAVKDATIESLLTNEIIYSHGGVQTIYDQKILNNPENILKGNSLQIYDISGTYYTNLIPLSETANVNITLPEVSGDILYKNNGTLFNEGGLLFAYGEDGSVRSLTTGNEGQILQSNGLDVAPSWINATEENIPETIVKRDDIGDIYLHDIFGNSFEATVSMTSSLFIGDLQGNADTATNADYATKAESATNDSNGNSIVNTYVPFTVEHQGASDFNTITTSGFHRVNNNLTNKPSNASEWGQLIVSHGGDTITQIYGDYSTGNLYTRSGNPSNVGGNGSWTSWKRLLTDTDTNNFVTLNTDQTITGTKTFNSTVVINPNTHDKIRLPRQGITKGTIPSEIVYNTVFFLDSSNDTSWPGGRMGQLQQSLDTNGVNIMSLTSLVPVANSIAQAELSLQASPDGSTKADFNTYLYAPELIVTNPNGVRFTYGGSGNTSSFLFRNDGTNFYGLICNSDSPGDNWIIPSGGGHPLRINLATGYVYTTRLYGAVWNDYAEYREGECIEPGYVMVETGYDTVRKSNERMEAFAGISSDTFGFAIGETDKAKIPIAVSGRVLVYTLRPRDEYKPGDCVCAAEGGKVDIMTREEIQQYPDRIVGTVSAVPEYETWGQNNIPVNGRIWIKVK